MVNENSIKNGVEITPANTPTLSPIHPGMFLQNRCKLITETETINMISPPTANCLPLCSVKSCFVIITTQDTSPHPPTNQLQL